MPKNDIEWLITPEGQLKMSWLKKIADYKEDDRVRLSIREKTSDITLNEEIVVPSINGTTTVAPEPEFKDYDGTALEVTVPSLMLGEEYEVFLEDVDTGKRHGPFNIEACEE